MSKWRIACSAAILAAGLAPSAHADEFTKLTLLTFSGPVDVPGITLPAGTYRFELADPTTSRRVVRVSDKDGTKSYGMFISMPNQRMTPTDNPVVMFKESAAGAPPAVQVWFYPGETYGYEFAYPHDQALKIAKATHQPVLAYADDSKGTSSDTDRLASMNKADVSRIDENDRPVSSDEALKESSEQRTPVATPAPTTAATSTSDTSRTAPSSSMNRTAGTTGNSDMTRSSGSSSRATGTSGTSNINGAAGTGSTGARAPMTGGSGASAQDSTAPAKPARQHLPRTASQLPLLAIFSALSLAGGLGVRFARRGAL
ncbi:MAG: hypothetical protein JWL71_2893 [Acidobacteria bacterium]|nr:hypothetical protein [Acidobacteriota bacterium]